MTRRAVSLMFAALAGMLGQPSDPALAFESRDVEDFACAWFPTYGDESVWDGAFHDYERSG